MDIFYSSEDVVCPESPPTLPHEFSEYVICRKSPLSFTQEVHEDIIVQESPPTLNDTHPKLINVLSAQKAQDEVPETPAGHTGENILSLPEVQKPIEN